MIDIIPGLEADVASLETQLKVAQDNSITGQIPNLLALLDTRRAELTAAQVGKAAWEQAQADRAAKAAAEEAAAKAAAEEAAAKAAAEEAAAEEAAAKAAAEEAAAKAAAEEAAAKAAAKAAKGK